MSRLGSGGLALMNYGSDMLRCYYLLAACGLSMTPERFWIRRFATVKSDGVPTLLPQTLMLKDRRVNPLRDSAQDACQPNDLFC